MSSVEKWIILAIIIIVNCYGLFVPTLHYADGYMYALISKEMFINGDWRNLTYHNIDWLDKPHFPFWITAVFYRFFGINAFAYVLPGFLFHLLGAYYLYRLAQLLFNDEVAYLAVLIFLSSIGIMLYSIDVRAEAYVLGEIIPACYYLLKYHHKFEIKWLFLAAFFVSLALMTKGLIVLFPIFSGLLTLLFYTDQIKDIFSVKWLLLSFLIFLMILPELYCLYLQFDLYPNKIVHGQHNISGIKWFFYGSQFGRFFNNDYIVDTRHRHFFYVGTFIWTFFPWSIVLIGLLYQSLLKKKLIIRKIPLNIIYLHGSYVIPIIIFMMTNFQREYYLIVVYPFIAILCANMMFETPGGSSVNYLNKFIIILVSVVIVYMSIRFMYEGASNWLVACIIIAIYNTCSLFLNLTGNKRQILIINLICSLNVFILLMGAKIFIDQKYNIGYNLSQKLTHNQELFIFDDLTYRLQDPILFHNNNVKVISRNQPLKTPILLFVENADFPSLANYNYIILY